MSSKERLMKRKKYIKATCEKQQSCLENNILKSALLASTLFLIVACVPPESKPKPVRIEEAGYISVGGIEQWVTIRGDDDSNPVLFYVHGGPGAAQSSFVDTYSFLEKDFVLVQWDQRGAGQTFKLYGNDTPDFNPERVIADGAELSDYLRERFPDSRLILMGHSYGSFLATGIRQRRPEMFSAYVGTGQFTQMGAGIGYQKAYLLEAAADRGDQETISWLNSMDPVVINGRWFGTLSRYMGATDIEWLDSIPELLASSPQIDDHWKEAIRDGQNFSGWRLVGTLPAINLFVTAPTSSAAFCVIQGSVDIQTPTPAAKSYFDLVEAPEKQMYILEGAGHFAIATHPSEYISALKKCPGVIRN
jgi:pimeloyl-ACP methyl ester carboxylesterase